MPKIFKSLFFQVVIALMLGIALGMANPDLALQMKPLGDGFIKLIKMLVPVIVFCVVVHGIAAAGDLSKVGRVGIRALIYFEIVTTIALMFGIGLAYYFRARRRNEHRSEDARRQGRLAGSARPRLRSPAAASPNSS